MTISDVRFIARCPGCDAQWELELEPVACVCDYADPDVLILPWTVAMEAA